MKFVEMCSMKKAIICLLSAFLLFVLASCSNNLTDKNDIISVFRKNESSFIEASESSAYKNLEKIKGIQKVIIWDDYIDIQCGGSGFGPHTHYYGIFFSLTDDLCAIDVAGPADELVDDGNGYRYQQQNGDNAYYVEPLGNHYFYYEAHF